MGHGPGCELTITVLTEDIGVHGVDIDFTFPAEKRSEMSVVENGRQSATASPPAAATQLRRSG